MLFFVGHSTLTFERASPIPDAVPVAEVCEGEGEEEYSVAPSASKDSHAAIPAATFSVFDGKLNIFP
jgi:hypothetical protein